MQLACSNLTVRLGGGVGEVAFSGTKGGDSLRRVDRVGGILLS